MGLILNLKIDLIHFTLGGGGGVLSIQGSGEEGLINTNLDLVGKGMNLSHSILALSLSHRLLMNNYYYKIEFTLLNNDQDLILTYTLTLLLLGKIRKSLPITSNIVEVSNTPGLINMNIGKQYLNLLLACELPTGSLMAIKHAKSLKLF